MSVKLRRLITRSNLSGRVFCRAGGSVKGFTIATAHRGISFCYDPALVELGAEP
jgi:hypothetical protein